MTDNSELLKAITPIKERIAFLEARQSREVAVLREHALATYESMKPVNLLKNTLKDFSSQPALKENLLDGAIGIATGYLSKKLLVGTSNNPIKKIAGTLFQVAITTLVAKNSSKIKAVGEVLLKYLFNRKTTTDKE